MMPTLVRPGLITPIVLGPTIRTPFSAARLWIFSESWNGTNSVMITTSGIR